MTVEPLETFKDSPYYDHVVEAGIILNETPEHIHLCIETYFEVLYDRTK